MKFLYHLTHLSFFCSVIFSCGNSDKYLVEINQLDSTLVLLDSAVIKINSIDTNLVSKNLATIKNDLKFCEENINDTLENETAMMLSEYRSCIKPFHLILNKYPVYSKGIQTSKTQISNLIHDLKANNINSEKVSEYVQNEIITANKIINEISLIETNAKMYLEKYAIFYPKASEFMISLNK